TAEPSAGRPAGSAARQSFARRTSSGAPPQRSRQSIASLRSAARACRKRLNSPPLREGGAPVRIAEGIAPRPKTAARRAPGRAPRVLGRQVPRRPDDGAGTGQGGGEGGGLFRAGGGRGEGRRGGGLFRARAAAGALLQPLGQPPVHDLDLAEGPHH